MQFADRTLGAEETQRVAEALARDPGLRARLDAFLATGPDFGAPFVEVLKKPVPPRLVAAIMTAGRTGSAAAVPQREPLGGIKALFDNMFSFSRPRWAPAFATALLVAGGIVGWQMQRVVQSPGADAQMRVDNGRITAQGVLARALETAAAGEITKDDAQALSVNVRLTFLAKSKAYCRQYDYSSGGGAYAGIACRAPDGAWQVQYHAPTSAPAPGGGRTVPVGDPKAQIGAFVDVMSVGDPLDRDEEARVRRQNWR